MNALFEQLGAYQFLNSILPGAAFFWGCRVFLGLDFPLDGLDEVLISYYMVGFFISRIGSLIVIPALKYIHIIKHHGHKYADFVRAEKIDPKVRTLADITSSYRSMLVSFLCVLVTKGCICLFSVKPQAAPILPWHLLFAIVLLMFASYCKQDSFVNSRVAAANEMAN